MKIVKITKFNSITPVVYVKYCSTFFSKFLGLMFKKTLSSDSGILLVNLSESKIDSSIHMFFMNFNICVLWLNKEFIIVDKIIAKKWHPGYFPKQAAQYVIELNSSNFSEFSIGDKLVIVDETN